MPSPSLRRPESGATLVEVSVTLVVLSLLSAMVLAVLDVVQRGVVKAEGRSRSVDEARLAARQIDRQIRSGNVLYTPESGGMALRVYTQANGEQKCVQWRLAGRQLQWRSWATTWATDGNVSPWRVAADDVVNAAVSPAVPLFALDTSQPEFGQRVMRIAILAKDDAGSGGQARVDLSVTGRNTLSYGSSTVCNDIPPL